MNQLISDIKNNHLYEMPFCKRVMLDVFDKSRPVPTFENSLKNTFGWIKQSFEATGDGGSSAYYHLGYGWKSSYPETTGYLIPTLYEYAEHSNDKSWSALARKASEWLLEIQDKEGGWQGLQIGVPCEPRIFNTGMILDGMIAAFLKEKDERYLVAAIKAMDWILSKIGENGLFTSNNPVKGGWSADILVLAYMSVVVQYTTKDKQAEYLKLIHKAMDAHLKFQQPNGWMAASNFEDSFRNTAVLHILGYAFDGLLVLFETTKEERYLNSAMKIAVELLSLYEATGQIPSYVSSDWSTYFDMGKTKASLCLTGLSQIAICFHKVALIKNKPEYATAANKLIERVASISNWQSSCSGLAYGVAGSYPISGHYQKYKILNWAAKFHAESILMSFGKCAPRRKDEKR